MAHGGHRVVGEVTKSFGMGVIPMGVWRLSRTGKRNSADRGGRLGRAGDSGEQETQGIRTQVRTSASRRQGAQGWTASRGHLKGLGSTGGFQQILAGSHVPVGASLCRRYGGLEDGAGLEAVKQLR